MNVFTYIVFACLYFAALRLVWLVTIETPVSEDEKRK